MSIGLVMPSNHLILCHSLLLLPSIFPSIRVFSSESLLHIRWPKDWSFSFNISPSNEYSGLTSFRIDWLDLLAVQGTLKSLLQHHSSKASILQLSLFFINTRGFGNWLNKFWWGFSLVKLEILRIIWDTHLDTHENQYNSIVSPAVVCTQSCLNVYDPTNCSPPGSSVHGDLQARRIKWVDISFSRGSSWP